MYLLFCWDDLCLQHIHIYCCPISSHYDTVLVRNYKETKCTPCIVGKSWESNWHINVNMNQDGPIRFGLVELRVLMAILIQRVCWEMQLKNIPNFKIIQEEATIASKEQFREWHLFAKSPTGASSYVPMACCFLICYSCLCQIWFPPPPLYFRNPQDAMVIKSCCQRMGWPLYYAK